MKKISITHILMLALFIACFLLFRQCGSTDNALERAIDAENNTVHDTIVEHVTGKSDTIHDTVPRWYPKLVPYYVGDTITADGDTASLYETTISDSLIDGKFTATVQGKVLFSSFEYRAKFPKYIYRTDTLKRDINTKETIIKDPWELYLGGVVGGSNTRFTLQPAALLRVPKKSFMFGYGYDVIQKTHNIHLYTKLKWPR